ncbi:TPA: hypothetical protein JRS25_003664 [Escherichia coli]|nr:hypothetical protein [Escherichia coli]HAY3976943.1 hypothetical protein [Escherichia coli]HBB9210913.1 hypothetical protein [Escherichia coli]
MFKHSKEFMQKFSLANTQLEKHKKNIEQSKKEFESRWKTMGKINLNQGKKLP